MSEIKIPVLTKSTSRLQSKKKQNTFLLTCYEENKRYLYAVALSIMKDAYRAEEVIQEAFLLMTRNSHKIRAVAAGKRRGYLATLVRNLCYAMLEKEKRCFTVPLTEVSERDLCDYFDGEPLMRAEDNRQLLLHGLTCLRESEREIILLRYYYDHTGEEIAALLGISHDAARQRIHRALKKLGGIVKEELKHDDL